MLKPHFYICKCSYYDIEKALIIWVKVDSQKIERKSYFAIQQDQNIFQ